MYYIRTLFCWHIYICQIQGWSVLRIAFVIWTGFKCIFCYIFNNSSFTPFLTGRIMVLRRPSVCPSVCLGLVGQTVSSRTLQIGTLVQHNQRKMPIIFQGQSSVAKVLLSHSRKKREWPVRCRIIQLSTIDQNDKLKMHIVFQGRRSKVKVKVGKLGRIHCRHETDWTISSKILQK